MPLDLNDQKVVDYSSNTPLFPFEYEGTFKFALVGYSYNPKAHNGACDIATLEVKESTLASVKPGQKYAFWFDQAATGKAQYFAAARIRSFMRAAVGVPPEDSRTFDANAARSALLSEDESGGLESGENLVELVRRGKKGAGEYEGKVFTEDTWTTVTA